MRDPAYTTITNDYVCFLSKNRSHEQRNFLTGVLAIRIGVHDNIGTYCERCVHSALESGGESSIAAMPNDVVHTAAVCDFEGSIRAAIVDYEGLNRINPIDSSRQSGDRVR
jgi:hypothetical protein